MQEVVREAGGECRTSGGGTSLPPSGACPSGIDEENVIPGKEYDSGPESVYSDDDDVDVAFNPEEDD